MSTERAMLDLLHQRYSQVNMGTTPRYLIAEQPNYRQRSRADAIVLDRNWTYDYDTPTTVRRPRYQAVHGYEVKCSRGDWLRELADTSKANTWSRFCHYWWVVASDKDIVMAGELPEHWGLLVPRGRHLAAVVKAPYRDAKPLTHDATLALILAHGRTLTRKETP